MVDEERSTQNERLTEEAATPDATDSGKDPATEIIETLKALPIDTAQVVLAKVLQELPHEEAKEVATSVVEALPDDATEVKKEVATSAVEALPEGATEAKIEIAASVVESLPDGAVAAKTEIATDAVHSLPAHATGAKKEIVRESVRDLPPEFRDYLIADLVTMRRLFRRVFVWTIFGAFAVALVVAVSAAVGTALLGPEQMQTLLWVAVPVATLLLGYGFGRAHSEQKDIAHLREQNPERSNGGMVSGNPTARS